MRTADIIVIGGGLSGSAIALGLVRKGARNVVLFDEQLASQRLSRGNFGLTWFMCKGAGNPVYAQWSRLACRQWPEFAEGLEADTGYNVELDWTGGAVHAVGEDEFKAHQASIEAITKSCEEAGIDYPVTMLNRREFQDLIPDIALGEAVTGAMYTKEQGHVNPLKLLGALRWGFPKNGGTFYGGQTVSAVIPKSRGKVVVKTGMGDFETEKVVIASGHGTKRLLKGLGETLNIYPQRGQVMVTQRVPRVLKVPVLSVRQTQDGTFMIGLSTEDTAMDSKVTAEAMKNQAANAIRLFPELARLNWVRAWGAIRVMTPDGAPIYSRVRNHDNIFAVALHSAVSLAPLAAGTVAPWILGTDEHPLMSKFNNGRFNV